MENNRFWKGYNRLVDYALSKDRKRLPKTHPDYVYYEDHHIIPKSLGGSDSKDNLVLFTPKEHFIAHYLLTKFTHGTQKRSMVYAFNSFHMDRDGSRTLNTPRLFEKARKLKSEAMSGENNPNYGGKAQTVETGKKISKNRKGKCIGVSNAWHKNNRTKEELSERNKKSVEARLRNFEALSEEEKEQKRKKRSEATKKGWQNAPKISKEKSLSALRYWEYKTETELKEIDKKKAHPGKKNPRAKVFFLKSPEGKEYTVELMAELKRFCEEQNLVYNIIYKFSKAGGIIPEVSKMDAKYNKDYKYKKQRDNTTGWYIKPQRINQ